MKKIIAVIALSLVVASGAFAQGAPRQSGGFMGGLHGCCFGIRGAGHYNSGGKFTLYDWLEVLPVVSIVRIYSAVQGWGGITTEDLRAQNPGNFY